MKNNLRIMSVVMAVLMVMSVMFITPVAAKTEYSSAMNATVITAEDGKASLSDASSIVNAASQNGDKELIVNAGGHTLNFSISTTALNSLAQAGLNLTIYVKNVKIVMTPKTLTDLASKATGTAMISVNDGATLLDISITSIGAPVELTDKASVVVTRATDAGSIVVENGERMAFSYADTEKWGFKLDGSAKASTKKIESITFADTDAHWSKANVAFVAANGYFNGIAANTFAPDNKMTRAMAVTVLSRIDNFNGTAGNIPFGDVTADKWFAPAVSWAAANAIVPSGASFRPDDNITRIELMSMLYNFALKLGITNASEYAGKTLDFADADQVAEADKTAALFCTENGIITGYTSNSGTKTIKAGGEATRAEVATMMQRFVKYSVFKGSETVAKAGKYSEAMQKRGDLQNVYNKLVNDKELTVAYVGGSVTVGAGASNQETTSWRGLINTWFKTNFPEANITMINASVGSSGSHASAFRIQEEVLPKNADLVFTEFAVNDAYSGTVTDKKVEMYYESVVRQIREALPEAEIIAIYVTNQGSYATYNLQGKYLPAAASHEKVCEAYGISSIDVAGAMALEFGKEMQSMWGQYFKDSVHPLDKGHAFYASVIEEYLNEYLLGPTSFTYGETRTYTNPETYVDKRNETFKPIYIPIKSLDIFDDIKGFDFSSELYYHHNGSITPNSADNQFTLTFEGTALDFFCDIQGGYSFKYTVDGGEVKTGRIAGSNHPAKCISNLGEGKHTITFTSTGDKGDGVFGKTRKIGGLLIHGTK